VPIVSRHRAEKLTYDQTTLWHTVCGEWRVDILITQSPLLALRLSAPRQG